MVTTPTRDGAQLTRLSEDMRKLLMNADLGFDESIAGPIKAPLAGAGGDPQLPMPDTTKLGSLPRKLRRSRKDSVTGSETSSDSVLSNWQ
jgi:hypothetical protein